MGGRHVCLNSQPLTKWRSMSPNFLQNPATNHICPRRSARFGAFLLLILLFSRVLFPVVSCSFEPIWRQALRGWPEFFFGSAKAKSGACAQKHAAVPAPAVVAAAGRAGVAD